MRYERHIDLKQVGSIWKNNFSFRAKLSQSKRFVREALNLCQSPYLSLSGGKDSVAMLGIVDDVAKEMNRDFVCWTHISDASFPETLSTCEFACKKLGRKLIIDHSPVSAFDVVGKQSSIKFGKKGFFFDAIKRMSEKHDLAFVGIRAAESKRRRDSCNSHKHLFHTKVVGDILISHPIKWFDIKDVAATINIYKLPIHPIYEKMPIGSMPIRLGYVTSLDLLERGTVVFLKKNYPILYKRLVSVYPLAKDYV